MLRNFTHKGEKTQFAASSPSADSKKRKHPGGNFEGTVVAATS
jgi:hypothetical protein